MLTTYHPREASNATSLGIDGYCMKQTSTFVIHQKQLCLSMQTLR